MLQNVWIYSKDAAVDYQALTVVKHWVPMPFFASGNTQCSEYRPRQNSCVEANQSQYSFRRPKKLHIPTDLEENFVVGLTCNDDNRYKLMLK